MLTSKDYKIINDFLKEFSIPEAQKKGLALAALGIFEDLGVTENAFISIRAIYLDSLLANYPLEINYPIPNATWDYAFHYQAVIALHQEVMTLLGAVGDQDKWSPEGDETLRNHLNNIIDKTKIITSLMALIKS